MEVDESIQDDSMEATTENGEKKKKKKKSKVFLPGQPLKDDEELVCDMSAYIMLRQMQTGAPCLSFDIIPDELGTNRTEFPATCYLVAGTNGQSVKDNNVIVMKLSNMHKNHKPNESDDAESSSSESDVDDDDVEGGENNEKKPLLNYASIAHYGCVNRIRSCVYNDTVLAAAWSEMGRVNIYDLRKQIQAINDLKLLAKYRKDDEIVKSKPIFTFSGHQTEGFAIDWSPTKPGLLSTGDCRKNIHIWNPSSSGWIVDQTPLVGHTDSVEDLQWSPNEQNVLMSCSVDKSIRVWDTRAAAHKACMISVDEAHTMDVNVINWNKNEPYVVSGGDDACIKIWDLRLLKRGSAVAIFKHHSAPITTVEWHPKESSVLASGGEDNQTALWDLSVEKDSESSENEIENVPPQLLFIHQGQREVKELHWHPQIPGLVISTAIDGFNIFKTISV